MLLYYELYYGWIMNVHMNYELMLLYTAIQMRNSLRPESVVSRVLELVGTCSSWPNCSACSWDQLPRSPSSSTLMRLSHWAGCEIVSTVIFDKMFTDVQAWLRICEEIWRCGQTCLSHPKPLRQFCRLCHPILTNSQQCAGLLVGWLYSWLSATFPCLGVH